VGGKVFSRTESERSHRGAEGEKGRLFTPDIFKHIGGGLEGKKGGKEITLALKHEGQALFGQQSMDKGGGGLWRKESARSSILSKLHTSACWRGY